MFPSLQDLLTCNCEEGHARTAVGRLSAKKKLCIDELMKWKHIFPPLADSKCIDDLLGAVDESLLSCVFYSLTENSTAEATQEVSGAQREREGDLHGNELEGESMHEHGDSAGEALVETFCAFSIRTSGDGCIAEWQLFGLLAAAHCLSLHLLQALRRNPSRSWSLMRRCRPVRLGPEAPGGGIRTTPSHCPSPARKRASTYRHRTLQTWWRACERPNRLQAPSLESMALHIGQ